MIPIIRLATTFLALAFIGACVDAAPPDVETSPSLGIQGCLRDVMKITNNSQVKVLETLESEAGTKVKVGVGPEMAPWQCIGYSDGTTAGVMSLVDEGAL
jgi:hypothetical protein